MTKYEVVKNAFPAIKMVHHFFTGNREERYTYVDNSTIKSVDFKPLAMYIRDFSNSILDKLEIGGKRYSIYKIGTLSPSVKILHLKTDIRWGKAYRMFNFHFEGSIYRLSEIIDTRVFGYMYGSRGLINIDRIGTHADKLSFYKSSDGYMCMKIENDDWYFSNVLIHSIATANNKWQTNIIEGRFNDENY